MLGIAMQRVKLGNGGGQWHYFPVTSSHKSLTFKFKMPSILCSTYHLPTNMNDVKIFYILVQANNGLYKVLHVDAVPFTNSLITLRDSSHGPRNRGGEKSMGFGHLQGSSGTYYY